MPGRGPVVAPPVGGSGATGLVVLAVAVALTAVLAWWLRRRGAVRTSGRAEQARTPAALERLGVRPGDAELTVVQFSSAFCGPCRATRARLQQLQSTRPGLAYVDVDAESHLAEVRELDVRRTPTLFYLGQDGTLIGRSNGAPPAAQLTALVDAHTGAAG